MRITLKKQPINILAAFLISLTLHSCKKESTTGGGPINPPPPPVAGAITASFKVNNIAGSGSFKHVNTYPIITISFSEALQVNTIDAGIALASSSGTAISIHPVAGNGNKDVTFTTPLQGFTTYTLTVNTSVKSVSGATLATPLSILISTGIDSTRKFPAVSDSVLLDKVQQQTFKYFYDFGHPVSGLARERNTSGETCTSGGSGFGVMALVTGINRNFITRTQGLARMQTIVGFLKNTAQTVHGAFPHWINGSTGAIIPFSAQDDGADLVETSYLAEGLICARQYFSGAGTEATLRTDINTILDRIEWDFFRQGGQQQLYWHYSNNFQWAINLKIKGWNEALMPYIMGAASSTHSIPASVYTNGWASNGASNFVNGNVYYGYTLPLGPALGGPLFFEHYSFMGIKPAGLSDAYANYNTQTINHTLINYNYCKANPLGYYGYSDSVWGLTASDIPNGYTASSPTNDRGIIAPTAALSSFPYTPTESMKALKFFYYVLGDKIFKEYGFVDAFSLDQPWFATSFLAIDQGPIIVMIENYRTQLLWNLFTSAPEVKAGMTSLGFTAPYL